MAEQKHFVGEIIKLPCYDIKSNQWFTQDVRDKTYDAYYDSFPHLFKKMEWWQKRLLDDLVSVKFVKIVKYRGYWKEGDIVPATLQLEGFIPIGYILKYNHFQPVFELEPATKEEYELQTKIQ